MSGELDRRLLQRAAAHPALASVAETLEELLRAEKLDVAFLDACLSAAAGVRFELQPPKRRRREPFDPRRSYDGSITTRGVVPTREDSLHDLMNALAWARFPRAKRAIHQRQFQALCAEVSLGTMTLPGRRSRLRDRLSMLDEGGVLVLGGAALDAELASATVPAALRVLVLGHAVTEQVARDPSVDIRTCVVRLPAQEEEADRVLAERIAEQSDGELQEWIGRFPSLELSRLVPN